MSQPDEPTETSLPQRLGIPLEVWAVVAAFGTYFCMYAFRKPFTAATFETDTFFGYGLKPVLIATQVFGYTLSKFIGIKVISEVNPARRVVLLLGLIGVAEFALLLFGLTPAPYNFVWLFFNGLTLGMVFGLVLGFLEGRRNTEILTAGLCTSFIVASGVVKSTGSELVEQGVSEYWMPFTAGLIFVPPLLFFAWMLSRIPPPSAEDIAARTERTTMDSAERRAFFWRYAPGLSLLVLVYLLITVLRSLRDDFMPELWKGLGEEVSSDIFTQTELAVAFGVLLLNGSAVLIARNRLAFFYGLSLAIGGACLVAATLLGLSAGVLSPFEFMVLQGLGLYLPYIAVHTTIFERLIAMTRDRGTIGYLMYLADAIGYLGYVAVLGGKELIKPGANFLPFFEAVSWGIAGCCVVLLVPCWVYFARHPGARKEGQA